MFDSPETDFVNGESFGELNTTVPYWFVRAQITGHRFLTASCGNAAVDVEQTIAELNAHNDETYGRKYQRSV